MFLILYLEQEMKDIFSLKDLSFTIHRKEKLMRMEQWVSFTFPKKDVNMFCETLIFCASVDLEGR